MLPSAGGRAGEGGERGLVADSAAMGPAHEQLSGDDRSDAGLGELRRPGGMGLDQRE